MPMATRDERLLPAVIRAMLKPDFYPHPADNIELKQTHTSYVLLAGEFVYKVRKAVRFAFIDCSTAARRFALCQREFELNRRLSPDVYLAVVAIRETSGRIMLDDSGDRTGAMEYAVKMRRLPDARRLDQMIERNTVTTDNITEIASTIANFHARASNTHSWSYGAAANVWQMTIGNLVEIEQIASAPLLEKIAQIEAYNRRYIAAHWEFLNSRAHDGRIRDGHGDLRADAVYLTADEIRIIDCLEFDERLRYGDIANEIAFLAMDIDRLGRPHLSRELVAHFLCDADVAVLMPFYKCYRATVRAKVELLRSRQQDCSAEDKQRALASAGNLLTLAFDYAAGPKPLLVVCGASGTSKSTFAKVLSEHLGFVAFSSDVIRKQLAGIEPGQPAPAIYNQGIYTPDFTSRVYTSLLAEAKKTLNSGRGVILDATFGKRTQRQSAIELANEAGVQPLFIECRAAEDVILQRLSLREHDSERISDATVEIYLKQIKEFEPLDEIPPAWRQFVNTVQDPGAIALEVERRIYAREYTLVPLVKS
jgi:aminoglycoside phosphotransferase family enzyme/predicted kinase